MTNGMENLKECDHCGLHYELEVGFFYGAMYVSYALGIALFVTLWVATSVLWPNMEMWTQIISIISVIVVFAPVNYYLSRLIWINFFVKYKSNPENYRKQKKRHDFHTSISESA